MLKLAYYDVGLSIFLRELLMKKIKDSRTGCILQSDSRPDSADENDRIHCSE